MNFPFLKAAAETMGTRFAAEKLAKIDPGKAEVLEKRFKKQKLAEMKRHTRKMDLLKETVKLIIEGIQRATCLSLGVLMVISYFFFIFLKT